MKRLCRAIGLEGREALIRAYGAREIATGLAILSTHHATAWVWGRVGGDALDLMALTAGLRDGKERAANVALAVAAVAAVTMLDVICAKGLPAEKGDRRTAIADYSDRSGFARPVQEMRGAAVRSRRRDHSGQVHSRDEATIGL